MTAAARARRCAIFSVLLLLASAFAEAADAGFRIGVYYYPGWRDDTLGSVSPKPWEALRDYPEREPLLGYYRDGDPAIMARQIDWMAEYGLDFVVFDWYWNHQAGALKKHALDAFFSAPQRRGLKAGLLWANHTEFPASAAQFERMVAAWLAYFAHPDYLRIDGRPAVFVFSIRQLADKAQVFGSSAEVLLDRAREMARAAGFPGIYFIGATSANSPLLAKPGSTAGFDALSAYNYHGAATFRYPGGHAESHSFEELDRGYRDHWQWMMARSPLPYILPMTTGWDRRPWGGSGDRLHDQSRAAPAEFAAHLEAARAMMIRHPAQTLRMGVICCWNEYGEGSFLEPTKSGQFALLERVRQTFGDAK